MRKLPNLFVLSVLGLMAWATPDAAAQTVSTLPPWIKRKPEASAPAPQPAPTTTSTGVLEEVFGRTPSNDDRRYDNRRDRRDYPNNMPPGQAKKRGYRSNPSNGGLPPGQAKKQYRNGYDDRRYDDRRDHDDHGKKGKGHGKGKH
jgi:hypothetical protein